MKARASRQQAVIKRAKDEIEKRTGKTTEELYNERDTRFMDAIQLKIPDRMPVYIRGAYFPVNYARVSPSAIYYDSATYQGAIIKFLLDYDPDVMPQINQASGNALGTIGTKQYLWPGGPLPPDQHAQSIELENMKEDEYDIVMTDPSDYMLRYYLPRAFEALAPFAKLPYLPRLVSPYSMVPQLSRFITPEIVQAIQVFHKAGQEQEKFEEWHLQVGGELGYVPLTYSGGGVITPFDWLTDYLRGMRGIAVDMFKQPEKLLAAMERIHEWNLARSVSVAPRERAKKRVAGGGSHWGSEAFLSIKQFGKFYWPTWKKSLMAAIEKGFIPMMSPEGKSDDRLEYFLELPKGKAILFNVLPGIIRAKEILGGHICIMGGMPSSLLWGGSPQEVDEFCKNLIKVCGKGGGFILACRSIEDDAKPANLKAYVDAIKKYSRH